MKKWIEHPFAINEGIFLMGEEEFDYYTDEDFSWVGIEAIL